jgi:tetratricopeptide (TPR) repeat protein
LELYYGQSRKRTIRSSRNFTCSKEEFKMALKLSPDDFEIVFEYGNYLYSISKNVEAEEYYTRALEIRPNNVLALTFMGLNKLVLNQLDLDSLLKEAYDCCESIYRTKSEYRETLYTMCYPKLVEALKTRDIKKLKSSILKCVSYEVKTPFLKQIYKKYPSSNKMATTSAIIGSVIGAGSLGCVGYNS